MLEGKGKCGIADVQRWIDFSAYRLGIEFVVEQSAIEVWNTFHSAGCAGSGSKGQETDGKTETQTQHR